MWLESALAITGALTFTASVFTITIILCAKLEHPEMLIRNSVCWHKRTSKRCLHGPADGTGTASAYLFKREPELTDEWGGQL